jgi:hypothetical protein
VRPLPPLTVGEADESRPAANAHVWTALRCRYVISMASLVGAPIGPSCWCGTWRRWPQCHSCVGPDHLHALEVLGRVGSSRSGGFDRSCASAPVRLLQASSDAVARAGSLKHHLLPSQIARPGGKPPVAAIRNACRVCSSPAPCSTDHKMKCSASCWSSRRARRYALEGR